MSAMNSTKSEVDHEFHPFLRVYKDGQVERFVGTDVVPASVDPQTGVSSKDVVIVPEHGISARLYLPKLSHTNQKLPVVVYFHGRGFCVSTPSTSMYHRYVNTLAAEANVVAVSVNYRLAPEHPLPAAYDDSWAALQWVVSHSQGEAGPESWLKDHADFGRVFLAGESAGANIAHNMAMRAGDPKFGLSVRLLRVALVHPYFWGSEPIGSEGMDTERKALVDSLWPYICPSKPDNDDPCINPVAAEAPSLLVLGCTRVLVCVAEKDVLRDRGWLYYETLGRSGWIGVVEITETEGEDHAFHLYNPNREKARDLVKRLAFFFNRESPPSL